MRQVTLPLPELAVIAATRALGAAGAALLIADRVPERKRRKIGWILFGIGIVSTAPLLLDVLRRNPTMACDEALPEPKAG